jgi:hypothetical protein
MCLLFLSDSRLQSMRHGPGNLRQQLYGVSGAITKLLTRVSDATASLCGQIVSDPLTHPAIRQELYASPLSVHQGDGWHGYRRERVMDPLSDFRPVFGSGYRARVRKVAQMPVRCLHVATIGVHARREGLKKLMQTPKDMPCAVTVYVAPLTNHRSPKDINLALRDVALGEVDRLIAIDDEVAIPGHFLDRSLYEAASLPISQPAHRFHSHPTWDITPCLWNSSYTQNASWTAAP